MALIGSWNAKDASGTTLPNAGKSASDGVLEGAALPIINSNGYLQFAGGNGTSGGDWNRVVFGTTDFEFTSVDPFTLILIYRSTDSSGTKMSLFSMRDDSSELYRYLKDGDNRLAWQIKGTSGNMVIYNTDADVYDGKWHDIIGSYDGISNTTLLFSGINIGSKTDSMSGNLYGANAKPVLGARWNDVAATYEEDFEGDVKFIQLYDEELNETRMKNKSLYFNHLMN